MKIFKVLLGLACVWGGSTSLFAQLEKPGLSPIKPFILPRWQNVSFDIELEAPLQTASGTAACTLEHRGVVLAKVSLQGQNRFDLSGSFLITKGIPEIQMNCSLDGFEDIDGILTLENSVYSGRSTFKEFKLVQSVQVNLAEHVATIHLKLPEFRRERIVVDGESFIQLSTTSKRVQINSAEASPRLAEYPQANFLLALPLDAKVQSVKVVPGTLAEELTMLLAPKSSPSKSGSLPTQEKMFNRQEYFSKSSNFTIANAVKYQPIQDDNQNIVRIISPLADVISLQSKVRFYRDMTIKVHFTHNSTCFRNPYPARDAVDRYRSSQFRGMEPFVVNIRDVLRGCPTYEKPAARPESGPNLIIVAPPEFSEQAALFKEHKENLGIRTSVLSWKGSDPTALKTLLQGSYELLADNYVQWILLLGDVKAIPTYYDKPLGDIDYGDFALSAGDIYYTQYAPAGTTYLASRETPISIGRIPARNPEELRLVLNRLMNFEKNPPSEETYYLSPTLTGTLEMDPAFRESGKFNNFAEVLERDLARPWLQKNFRPERIFRADQESVTPRFWSGQSSTALIDYTATTDRSGFPLFHMNGTQDMIESAWARGTNLLVNASHASPLQWSNPGFRYDAQRFAQFPADKSPFVVSLSCQVGFFDSETLIHSPNVLSEESPFYEMAPDSRYMSEQLILDPRGALGIIAANRQTLITLNHSMLKGLARAVVDKKDGDNRIPQDWGRIMSYAKNFSKIDLGYSDQSRALRHQFLVYNLLGDPSMELRQNPPFKIRSLSQPTYDPIKKSLRLSFKVEAPVCPVCDLSLQDEPEIAILRKTDNQIVGRAVVRRVKDNVIYNREVIWDHLDAWESERLQITLSGAGLAPYTHVIDNRLL